MSVFRPCYFRVFFPFLWRKHEFIARQPQKLAQRLGVQHFFFEPTSIGAFRDSRCTPHDLEACQEHNARAATAGDVAPRCSARKPTTPLDDAIKEQNGGVESHLFSRVLSIGMARYPSKHTPTAKSPSPCFRSLSSTPGGLAARLFQALHSHTHTCYVHYLPIASMNRPFSSRSISRRRYRQCCLWGIHSQ